MHEQSYLPEGVKYHNLFYPNYPWRGKPRQRTPAILDTRFRDDTAVITSTTGERWSFPLNRDGYQAAATLVTRERLTVYTSFVEGARRFPWLASAIEDERATVYAVPQKGPVGVSIQRGRQRGSFVSEANWHRDADLDGDTPNWLHNLQQVACLCGVGFHDTAAALGTAILYRYFHDQHLPSVIRLPSRMQEYFLRYRLGGRVEHVVQYGERHPLLYEADIKQAYPTAVGLGLPWGEHVYTTNDPTELCYRNGWVAYGQWVIHVHDDIEHSPVPDKNWDHINGKVTWHLKPGRYEYAGWDEEIVALRQTGKATCEWVRGWIWGPLSTALRGWVDEMGEYRERLSASGNAAAARMVKLAANATIGRWGMDPARIELVDEEHAAIGDGMITLPRWALVDAPGEPLMYMTHRETSDTRATPMHWCSFVRMRVRMEVWARSEAGRAQGAVVIIENFDEIISDKPIQLEGSPYTWKMKLLHDATIPYPRAVIALVEDGQGRTKYVQTLPGVPRKVRTKFVQETQAP